MIKPYDNFNVKGRNYCDAIWKKREKQKYTWQELGLYMYIIYVFLKSYIHFNVPLALTFNLLNFLNGIIHLQFWNCPSFSR